MNQMNDYITVIGAGIAGSEAAWQIAEKGIKVKLFEMKPIRKQAAHKSENFAELVCSNSLRGAGLENAPGLLKEELRLLESVFMAAADRHSVPAGGALAVDREEFSKDITETIKNHPLIEVCYQEVELINKDQITIIATGPLTDGKMMEEIRKFAGDDQFYFYDAAAPIVSADSVDYSKAYWASRYGKGTPDYLNCPMNREEYDHFYRELIHADTVPVNEIDKEVFFEGCMPVEVMAKRGLKTLLFGPLKPVGLEHPETGESYHAVVQLRKENREGTLLNLVGFQTHLKWGEQKRVFQLIPGLEQAEFMRYGVMHRNSFINSPKVLAEDSSLKEYPNLFFAGQITGVEGYIESCASGLLAGRYAAAKFLDKKALSLPAETATASLLRYITTSPSKNFQPMNINFGLLPKPEQKIKNKKERYLKISDNALKALRDYVKEL